MNRAWVIGFLMLGAQQASVAALFGEDVDKQARQEIADVKSEMEKHNQNIDKRINSLELGIKSLGLVEMVNQIEQLKEEIGKLRGQIELQNNQIETTQKRQRELYLDLDTRLRALEKTPGAASTSSDSSITGDAKPEPPASIDTSTKDEPKPATMPASPPVATAKPTPLPAKPSATATAPKPLSTGDAGGDIKSYEDAHKTFRSGNYQGAVNAFRGFIEQYPNSMLASNAQYWIGISFYNLKDLKAALGSHQHLLKRYPDSPKVPDSMLNIATIQADLNDNAAAHTTLEDIVAKYPSSEAATKARSRLTKRP